MIKALKSLVVLHLAIAIIIVLATVVYFSVQGTYQNVKFLVIGEPSYISEMKLKSDIVVKVSAIAGRGGKGVQETIEYLQQVATSGNPWAVYFHHELEQIRVLKECACELVDLNENKQAYLRNILIAGLSNPNAYSKEVIFDKIKSSKAFSDAEKRNYRDDLIEYRRDPANAIYHYEILEGTLAEKFITAAAIWNVYPWNFQVLRMAFS